MKKSVVLLGIALVSFSSVAMAGSAITSETSKKEIVLAYATVTPLCTAISKGDINIVRKFIEYGANVNEKSNGLTPLMIAARYNKVEIIKLLIENGADLRAENENGFTALKFAQLSNANEAATYLASVPKR